MASSDTALSVCIVDEVEMVRRGLSGILSDAPDIAVTGVAATAQEAIDLVAAEQPDVVLVDLSLADGRGVDLCSVLGAEAPRARIMAVCGTSEDDRLQEALVAGAAGYVVNSASAEEIVERVRSTHEGHVSIEPRLASELFDRLRSQEPSPHRRVADLTGRETEILDLVAEGLTNRQIGQTLHLSPKTVKNYVSVILKKLGMSTRVEAAVFATRISTLTTPAD